MIADKKNGSPRLLYAGIAYSWIVWFIPQKTSRILCHGIRAHRVHLYTILIGNQAPAIYPARSAYTRLAQPISRSNLHLQLTNIMFREVCSSPIRFRIPGLSKKVSIDPDLRNLW